MSPSPTLEPLLTYTTSQSSPNNTFYLAVGLSAPIPAFIGPSGGRIYQASPDLAINVRNSYNHFSGNRMVKSLSICW
ncbi:hypothetical protein CAC42_6340 [Sphaceloma murrayae]|uniref:Uncharacterized protein n=1 Tax=Sphaceloma murrayae TaxID=2082308 RepID=A0A2K1QN18_9PEZI|nr:hypothetical protein CAC42_6340 [Sphaceloma murrayae]